MSFQVSFRKWCLNRFLLFDYMMHLGFIGVVSGNVEPHLEVHALCEQFRS